MAIQGVSEPDDLLPAYTPLKFKWRTNLFPNTIPGESNIIIVSIGTPTAGDITAFPVLTSRDLLVKHAASTLMTVGQTITVAGNVPYNGIHTVTKVLDNTKLCITGSYQGNLAGGTWSKFYNNLRIKAQLTVNTTAIGKPYSLLVDGDGYATIDARGPCQEFMAQMKMVQPQFTFGALQWGLTNSYCTYSVSVWEAYDIPDSSGLPLFAEQKPPIPSTKKVTINACQPYAYDVPGQIYTYDDMLRPYKQGVTAIAKFLTHMPRGEAMPIGRGEHGRLEALNAATVSTDYTVQVKTYNGAGTLVNTHDTVVTIPARSVFYFIHGAGPMNSAWFPNTVVSYTIKLIAGAMESEVLTFRFYPQNCNDPLIRIHFRNRFSALDGFTFDGKRTITPSSTSTITQQSALDDRVAGTVESLRQTRFRVSEEKHTVTTAHVPTSIQRWLATEMVQSPQAFVTTHTTSGQLVPILFDDGEGPAFTENNARGVVTVTYIPANQTPHQRL